MGKIEGKEGIQETEIIIALVGGSIGSVLGKKNLGSTVNIDSEYR